MFDDMAKEKRPNPIEEIFEDERWRVSWYK